MADDSGKYSPIEWAQKAVGLYHKYSADRIVAEANQGGAMVETTVRTVDQNVSYKAVHASRGKITRAEPVPALAEQFRIQMVGAFLKLEDQLCSFQAGSSGSPDRLDAMVWAFSELLLDSRNNTGFLSFYKEMVETTHGRAPKLPSVTINQKTYFSLRCPPGTGIVCGISRAEYAPSMSRKLSHVEEIDQNDFVDPTIRAGNNR